MNSFQELTVEIDRLKDIYNRAIFSKTRATVRHRTILIIMKYNTLARHKVYDLFNWW